MSRNARIDRIIACFLQSDGWQFGSSSDDVLRDPDRYDRCEKAAEEGGDGSTHAEHIDDMRRGFTWWLSDRRRGRWADCDRIRAVVDQHWNELEAWHLANGSLFEEIG